jgi:CheY-like chemotaxis protein
LRLLVVEDNAINQQVARELLTAEGALIDIAANGQLGVDAVAKADPQYDAVLMDLQMPVMDGYTAAVAIRHELGLYELPIIAMTANAMASDRDACLEAGMNDHIGKPFDLPELVALLCRHTGRKAVPDLSPAPAPLAPANDPPQTLDTEGALARLGDNAALYRQILDSFLKELAAVPALLDTHLAAADYVESARLMHTIKGLSLTVGAVALSGICKEAENHFKNGSAKGQRPDPDTTAGVCARLRAAVETSSEALTAVALDLGPAEPGLKPASPPSGPLDAATFVAELRILQRLLRDSDMGALDLLATLMESYEANRPAEVDALQAAVSAFDFPKAVVQCETLINFFTPHGTQ